MKIGVTKVTKLQRYNPQSGFTMVEIALCLAIIAFALVAIIGVLPTGLSVQKDNREESSIGFDADFLLSAIRSGARGQDDLTNYVYTITNVETFYTLTYTHNGFPASTNLNGTPMTNWFTTTEFSVDNTAKTYSILTNGWNILGLLTIPKYVFNPNFFPLGTPPNTTFISNYVAADFRAITGSAMDQGESQDSRDFAFRYRVTPEIVPDAMFDPSWTNTVNTQTAAQTNYLLVAQALRGNLNQVRLRFNWPVYANGTLGNGGQVFRTSFSGALLPTNFLAFNVAGPLMPVYFIQSEVYSNWPGP